MPHRSSSSTRGRLFLVVLLAFGLLVAACSNKEKAQTSAKEKAKNEKEATVNSGAIREGTPKRGGVVKFGLESTIQTINPASTIAQPADEEVAHAVYDNLVEYDASGNLVGSLAKSFEPSADLKTWTFTLNTGITFHDGQPFNAQAVVDNENYYRDPNTKCACLPNMEQIADVTAPNESTVVFSLNAPNAVFPQLMAGNPGIIMAPGSYATAETNPVGTGAFQVDDFTALKFKANPNYWKKDVNGEKLPYLDGIQFIPLPDSTTRLKALQAGDVDIMQTADTTNIVNAQKDPDLQSQRVTGSSSTIILNNMKSGPASNENFRLAGAYAIDRDVINSRYYKNTRIPAYSAVPESSPWYDPKAQVPHHDLAKAKEYAQKAKAEGVDLTVEATCINTGEAKALLEIVRQQLQAAGITMKVTVEDQGKFVQKILAKTGDYQTACFRSPQIADPDNYYGTLYTNGSGNVTLYSNQKVDQALDAGRATADMTERKQQYDIVFEQIAKDLPVIPLLFDAYGNIFNKKISGLPAPEANSLGLIQVGYLYFKA